MDDQYRIPDSNSPANDQAADDAAPQANDDAAASASSAATDPIADAWTPVPAAGEQPPRQRISPASRPHPLRLTHGMSPYRMRQRAIQRPTRRRAAMAAAARQ